MVPDYHIHTSFCKHATGEIEEYLQVAREKNLSQVCITDHAPNPDGYDLNHRMEVAQFPAYRQKVKSFSARNQPSILLGIEADYYEGCEKFLGEWLPRQELDLVLGSIHYLKGWGFDNPDERQVWDNVDVTNTWREYFNLMRRLVATGFFDAIGHFDLPKKFGFVPPEKEIREMVQPVLDKIAAKDMAIEINTSGLRRPIKEIFPGIMVLELARLRSIPICFGSDAHQPQEVGHEFAAAVAWARQAGYTEAVHFAGRRKAAYTLPAVLRKDKNLNENPQSLSANNV
jgi:histidinol-phosphatase (PHP family)